MPAAVNIAQVPGAEVIHDFKDNVNDFFTKLRCLRQIRRDGEIQLHPLEQREADLSEELHRQKEKERLRKEYIEELKKRHEEEKNRLESLHLKEQAGRRDDQVCCSVQGAYAARCILGARAYPH
jgi:predicted RNase H-like nuclease (RuvC/YqgF family)